MHSVNALQPSLYAGPVESAIPANLQRALERWLGEALSDLRATEPFGELGQAEWSVLVRVMMAWGRGEEGPSQSALAAFAGCSVRTVRRRIESLESSGVLLASKESGLADGYGMGPRLEPFLSDFARWRDPSIFRRTSRSLFRERATPDIGAKPTPDIHVTQSPMSAVSARTQDIRDRRESFPRSTTERGPARLGPTIATNLERIQVNPSSAQPGSLVTPDIRDTPLLIKEEELRSFSSFPEKGTPDTGAQPTLRSRHDLGTLRATAARALAVRHRLGFPDRSVPVSFPSFEIDLLVAVTANETCSVAELDQLHLDAIAGASLKSKRQPPSVQFIWGNHEYFLRSALEGRKQREAALAAAAAAVKKPPKPKEPPPKIATLDEVAAYCRDAVAMLDGLATDEPRRLPNTRFFSSTSGDFNDR